MTQLVIPNVFVNGTVADADPVNQNFDAVRAAVNSIDSTNIGTAGIWASHIKQTTVAQGTFGDSEYRFQQRDATKVPLTIHSTQATPQADLFDVIDQAGTKRLWLGPDYVLHGDFDFSGSITGLYASDIVPTTEAEATFGGSKGYKFEQRDAGEVPLTLKAHASPTGDLFNVVDSAGTKMLWIGSGFAVHMAKALNCDQILMTDQGILNFGDNGSFSTYPAGLGVRMFGGCAYNWTLGGIYATATATSASVWHVGSGSRPFAAYVATPVTPGALITNMTEVWYLTQTGSIQMTQPNTVAPFISIGGTSQSAAPFNMGLIPNGGFYMAFGAYFSQPLNSWIATAATATIMIWGYSPTFTGYNAMMTQDSGLTIGNGFSPTFVNGIGMGGSNMNAIVAQAGIQLRSGVGVAAGNGAVLWGGNQAPPPSAVGNNGDYYFNTSTPGTANQRIYVKNNAGNWVGIA